MRAAFLLAVPGDDTMGCFVFEVDSGDVQRMLDGTIAMGACRRSAQGGRSASPPRGRGNGAGEDG